MNRDPARRFPQAEEATHRLLDVLRGRAVRGVPAPARRVWPYVIVVAAIAVFGLVAAASAVVLARAHSTTRTQIEAGAAMQALVPVSSPSDEAPVVALLEPSAVPTTSSIASAPVVRARPSSKPPAVTTTGVDASYAAYAQGQITPLIQQCWTAAQKETPNHPTETLRLTIHISEITGRAFQVDASGVNDLHLQWCIQADIQRFQFRRPNIGVDVSMSITLTPD